MKRWPIEAEREFWAAACAPGAHEDSLYWFTRVAWGAEWYFRSTGEPRWLSPAIHKPFLRWLSKHIVAWKARRRAGRLGRTILVVLLPRAVGKSVLVTKSAGLWMHLDEPNMTSYIGSETHAKAMEFLAPIREVMRGTDHYSWFTGLYGDWYDASRTWNEKKVIHAARTAMGFSEPSFGTYGTDAGITSKHPLVVIYDDPNSQETLSQNTLLAARESYDATYPALRTDSLMIVVATRYAENDVPGYVFETEGIQTWEGMPDPDGRFPIGEGKAHVYFLQGRDTRNPTPESPEGLPVFPEVWDEEGLRQYKRKNPIFYVSQIMNTPTIGEHMPLERAQIDRMWISRDDLPPIEYATIHLDTAFKDEMKISHGDYNVILVALHDLRANGMVYIDKIIRNSTDRAEKFVTSLLGVLYSLRARDIRVRAITDEIEGGGKRGVFRQHLEMVINNAGIRCPEIILLNRGGTKKFHRIREAAAYWAEGYVRLIKGTDNSHFLVNEMLTMEKSTHDDVADAAADVFRPEIWRKPQSLLPDSIEDPIQPGDDILRPGLPRRLVLHGDALSRRVAELFPSGLPPRAGESDPWDDFGNPIR